MEINFVLIKTFQTFYNFYKVIALLNCKNKLMIEKIISFMPSPYVRMDPSWPSIKHGHSRITVHLENATFNVCETLNFDVRLELHGEVVCLRGCRTCNETFTHYQSLLSILFPWNTEYFARIWSVPFGVWGSDSQPTAR